MDKTKRKKFSLKDLYLKLIPALLILLLVLPLLTG